MGLLTELASVKAVADAVELLDVDVLDFEHLELDDGRDFLMALVSGPHAEKVVALLERLRSWSKPAAADALVTASASEDMLSIVELLQEWHRTRIEKLELVANAKPDVKIEARGPDGKPLLLTGPLRAGFQEGANLALQMFGKFPLSVCESSDELGEEE